MKRSVRRTYFALRQPLDPVSRRVELHLDVFRTCTFLRVRRVQEPVQAYRVTKLDISLRLVCFLCVTVELYALHPSVSIASNGEQRRANLQLNLNQWG